MRLFSGEKGLWPSRRQVFPSLFDGRDRRRCLYGGDPSLIYSKLRRAAKRPRADFSGNSPEPFQTALLSARGGKHPIRHKRQTVDNSVTQSMIVSGLLART